MEKKQNEGSDDNHYFLPSWRFDEVINKAVDVFFLARFYEENVCIIDKIRELGIKVIPYSSFSDENLDALMDFNISFWKEGVCYIFYEQGERKCTIAYNDTNKACNIEALLLHELAHFCLDHTQQCPAGELEATCFTTAMLLLRSSRYKKMINTVLNGKEEQKFKC